MKRTFLSLFCFLFLCLPYADAKVYWVARNILLNRNNPQSNKMVTEWGHSYIIIVPDNPAVTALRSPLYRKYEKSLGCNKRGIVIGGYPYNGTKEVGDMDGDLGAEINASREDVPTQVFLCGTAAQKKKWGLASGEVKTNLSEIDFINNLLNRTEDYLRTIKKYPIDYNAVRSILDGLSTSNTKANNCNSFAFSLLAYSGATSAPDLGAKRVLPGIRHLLPAANFFGGSALVPAGYVPALVKNDRAYRERVCRAVRTRMGLDPSSCSESPYK